MTLFDFLTALAYPLENWSLGRFISCLTPGQLQKKGTEEEAGGCMQS